MIILKCRQNEKDFLRCIYIAFAFIREHLHENLPLSHMKHHILFEALYNVPTKHLMTFRTDIKLFSIIWQDTLKSFPPTSSYFFLLLWKQKLLLWVFVVIIIWVLWWMKLHTQEGILVTNNTRRNIFFPLLKL